MNEDVVNSSNIIIFGKLEMFSAPFPQHWQQKSLQLTYDVYSLYTVSVTEGEGTHRMDVNKAPYF